MVEPSGSSQRQQPPFLPPSEWRIYSLLARHGPLTVRQMLDALPQDGSKGHHQYMTVRTLALRLVEKGYLAEGPKGAAAGPSSVVVFSPLVPYDEALDRHLDHFVAQYALGGKSDIQAFRRAIERHLNE